MVGSIVIPPKQIVGDDLYLQLCWEHLYQSAIAAGVIVVISEVPRKINDVAFEFYVDGKPAVYDYSDYLHLTPEVYQHEHWFRFHYTEAYHQLPNLHSFPPMSFHDWPLFFGWMHENIRYNPMLSTRIMHKQAEHLPEDLPVHRDRYRRRRAVRSRLIARFGDRIDHTIDEQIYYWFKAGLCRASVHIPGSWRHSLDRGQHQLMGLGVCTISPEIWTACCHSRPAAGIHYYSIQDDYSNLEDVVQMLLDLPELCAQIGYQARDWFMRNSTPEAIWHHVDHCMAGAKTILGAY